MKVQIVLVGFNRSFSVSFPSLKENLINPITTRYGPPRTSLVVSRSRETIANPWTGESVAGEWDIPEVLNADDIQIFTQGDVDDSLEKLESWVGTALPERSPLDQSIHKNLLRELTLLDRARNMIDFASDWIIYSRADLFFLDPFSLKHAIIRRYLDSLTGKDKLYIPHWGYQPNDLVAIMSPQVAATYFGRISQVQNFVTNHGELQSERLLDFSFPKNSVKKVKIARAVRVRAGGEVKFQRFGRPRHRIMRKVLPGWFLRILVQSKKSVTTFLSP
jgi:hypothetical protein